MENKLLTGKNALVYLDQEQKLQLTNFCGVVFDEMEDFVQSKLNCPDSILYLCGNVERFVEQKQFIKNEMIYVVEDYSTNFSNKNLVCVSVGSLPINMYNVGVYFREFFDSTKDYFKSVTEQHQFQSLTESNKGNSAYRTGIYLTNVEEDNGETRFNLLRCSTNFDGPTDNFRDADNEIVNNVNSISKHFFKENVNLNHVLAQVYNNSVDGVKQRKAKIKEHSDKTKDMPRNALMAFCTFYKNDKFGKEFKRSTDDPYDYCFKNTSVLTRLRFRLKESVQDQNLVKQFDLTLYPNSVFLMSLETNRLYTHEIKPSVLPIDKIPTRMGYVIRCSNTKAVFKDNQTYMITDDNKYVKLEKISEDEIKRIKELYKKENSTTEIVDYSNIYVSMNKGDYQKPIV